MRDSDIPIKFPVAFAHDVITDPAKAVYPLPTAAQTGGHASLDTGYPPVTFVPVDAGGIPPWGNDTNGILYQLSAWARWVQAGGRIPYDSTFQSGIGGYPSGAIITSTGNNRLLWLSTVEDNLTNPDAGGAGWLPLPLDLQFGGFINRDRNSTLDIWTRGTTGSIAPGNSAYTADGWIVAAVGSTCHWSQAPGLSRTLYSLSVNNGPPAIMGVRIKKRIESFLAMFLSAQNVTVQMRVQNNSGAAVTPLITVKHLNSSDVGVASPWDTIPSTIDINAQPMQTVANGAQGVISYTFLASSVSGNGVEVTIDFGATAFGAAGGNIAMAEFDIRVTPWTVPGIAYSAPLPELRPIQIEALMCARYLPAVVSYGAICTVAMQDAHNGDAPVRYRTNSRIAPSGLVVSAPGDFNLSLSGSNKTCTDLQPSNFGTEGSTITVSDTVNTYGANSASVLSVLNGGSLYFTGAEL